MEALETFEDGGADGGADENSLTTGCHSDNATTASKAGSGGTVQKHALGASARLMQTGSTVLPEEEGEDHEADGHYLHEPGMELLMVGKPLARDDEGAAK